MSGGTNENQKTPGRTAGFLRQDLNHTPTKYKPAVLPLHQQAVPCSVNGYNILSTVFNNVKKQTGKHFKMWPSPGTVNKMSISAPILFTPRMKAANFSEMLVNQPTKRSSRNHSR
jgi:hypothetical protein